MKSRNVLVADFDLDSLTKFTMHFLSKGFSTLTTDMKGFNSYILNGFPLSLAIVADPDELPGGLYLFNLLLNHYPAVPILIICSSEVAAERYAREHNSPQIKIVQRFEAWGTCLTKIMDLLLVNNRDSAGRRHDRVKVQIPVVCEVLGPGRFIPGEIHNVSRSGAFIVSSGAIPDKGEVVDLEFEASRAGLKRVQASGVVRWTRDADEESSQPGFGVEFAYFDCDERDAFKSLSIEAL